MSNNKQQQQEEPKYPHVIVQDDDGKLVAYSRGSVSWIPFHRKPKPTPVKQPEPALA